MAHSLCAAKRRNKNKYYFKMLMFSINISLHTAQAIHKELHHTTKFPEKFKYCWVIHDGKYLWPIVFLQQNGVIKICFKMLILSINTSLHNAQAILKVSRTLHHKTRFSRRIQILLGHSWREIPVAHSLLTAKWRNKNTFQDAHFVNAYQFTQCFGHSKGFFQSKGQDIRF